MWKLLSKASIAAAVAALAVTTLSAPANAQGTPVPLPRPLPDSTQPGNLQPDKSQDGSLDVVALPKQLVDQLPKTGVVPPELAGQVRDALGDRLDGVGSIELPNRRLTTDPNGDLVVLDPSDAADDGVVSADRPVKAQQTGDAPTADLGAIVQSLLSPTGPLAGLQGLNGGIK